MNGAEVAVLQQVYHEVLCRLHKQQSSLSILCHKSAYVQVLRRNQYRPRITAAHQTASLDASTHLLQRQQALCCPAKGRWRKHIGDLPHQPRKRHFPDEQLCGSLVLSDFPQRDCAWPISVRLFHPAYNQTGHHCCAEWHWPCFQQSCGSVINHNCGGLFSNHSPVPVAGICFLPLRAAVVGVLRAPAVPGPPALAPPLCAGDRGAGAADLTGVRGTGLPFGACSVDHRRTSHNQPEGTSDSLPAALCQPCSDGTTPADRRRFWTEWICA
jgi:hypothetical protein